MASSKDDKPPAAYVANVAVPFLVKEPLLESRRLMVTGPELVKLVGEHLIKRGMSPDKLDRTKWVWVENDGVPTLCLIFPGLEA